MKWLLTSCILLFNLSSIKSIEFKLHNDTDKGLHYFINEERNHLPSKETNDHEVPVGSKLYFDNNGKKGSFWFEVIDRHHKTKLKISEV